MTCSGKRGYIVCCLLQVVLWDFLISIYVLYFSLGQFYGPTVKVSNVIVFKTGPYENIKTIF